MIKHAASAGDEITMWMDQLSQGDSEAAQAIWDAYFEKLVRFARQKLVASRRRVADEEDIALSAMNSFFDGATAGRFPRLHDRTDLWKLLITITARKAVAELRRQRAQKRGGGEVSGESVLLDADDSDAPGGLGQVMGRVPTPEFAAMMAEDCDRLLNNLKEETLRSIALLKLQGYNNNEVALEIGCTIRTVERKLERIRESWSVNS